MSWINSNPDKLPYPIAKVYAAHGHTIVRAEMKPVRCSWDNCMTHRVPGDQQHGARDGVAAVPGCVECLAAQVGAKVSRRG